MKTQIQQLRPKYTKIKELLNRTGNKVFNDIQNQYRSTSVMYLSIQKLPHSTCMMYLTATKNFTGVPALHNSTLPQTVDTSCVPGHNNHQGSITTYSTCNLCEIKESFSSESNLYYSKQETWNITLQFLCRLHTYEIPLNTQHTLSQNISNFKIYRLFEKHWTCGVLCTRYTPESNF